VQFQTRTNQNAWGLRGLSLRLPLDSSITGDTLDIVARVRPASWQLLLHSRSVVDSISLPLTVGLGWTTLLPAPLSITYEQYVLNALWLAGLLVPAAYWFFRAGRSRGLLTGAVFSCASLVLIPLASGIAMSTTPDWVGGGLGLLVGSLLARRSLTHHPAA
jgi:hypothetical protein